MIAGQSALKTDAPFAIVASAAPEAGANDSGPTDAPMMAAIDEPGGCA